MTGSLGSKELVRLLADRDRRCVVAALILAAGPTAASDVAAAADLPVRDTLAALDRLATAGLVLRSDETFAVRDDAFEVAARAEAIAPEPSPHSDQPYDVARVLDLAFKDGQLVQWPAKRAKRLVVLDFMAQRFDIGQRYKETEVNNRLRSFGADVATMRRYLVDEQFMDRSSGEYWRCGGSF